MSNLHSPSTLHACMFTSKDAMMHAAPEHKAPGTSVHTWDLMDPLEPACCMPERPAEGGRERGGVSAAFAGEVLAAELPQVLPVSSQFLSARHS